MTDDPAVPPRHPARTAIIVVVAVVVLLAIAAVVAEVVLRGVVDRRIASQVEQSLPKGTTGDVHAHANGIVLTQLLSGALDDVDMSSRRLTVQGVPLVVHATVHDLPVNGAGTTGAVDARIRLTADAVRDAGVLDRVGGDISLRKGGIAWHGSTRILGSDVDYRVLADVAASATGRGVTVTPQRISVTNSALGIDFGGDVPGVSGTPVNLCTASYLPAELRLRALAVTRAAAVVRVTAAHLPLSEDGLRTTGTC